MSKHTYVVWNANHLGWDNYASLLPAERAEATRKGLVEHDPWCSCVKVTDEPPF